MILESTIKKKIFKNSLWLMGLQGINIVIPALMIPYIIRVLGNEKYGIFSWGVNLVFYFQIFIEYGFNLYGVQKFVNLTEKELQKLYDIIISSRLFLSCLSLIIFFILNFIFFLDKERLEVITILFLGVLGHSFNLNWLFQGKQEMKFITYINGITKIINLIMILKLVSSPKDLNLYCWLYSLNIFFIGILEILISRIKYNLKLRIPKIRKIKEGLKEGYTLFEAQMFGKIFGNFGVTILGFFFSVNAVGIYSAIYKIPYLVMMIFSPIGQALFPNTTLFFQESTIEAKKKIFKIASVINLIFGIIIFILIVFRKIIIELYLGKSYIEYSNLLIPLLIWSGISIINNFLGIQILVASGHSKEYKNSFMISIIISILLNFLLIFRFGIYGLAYSNLVSELVFMLILLKKCINLN